MSKFTEMDHAAIAALFYQQLIQYDYQRGKEAFILCTQKYGEQRGSRMAQRAIKDGRQRDFRTYRQYTEWKASDSSVHQHLNNQSEILSYSPDFKVKITRCPWAASFAQMHMKEAGDMYCRIIDTSLVRGFNPSLHYETIQNLNTSDYCLQICTNAYLDEKEELPAHPEYIRDFAYHCAHLYWTFNRLITAMFGEDGKKMGEEVLKYFDEEKRNALLSYQNTDFNVI